MLHAKTRWMRNDSNEQKVAEMAEALGVHPLVAKLLVVRGFEQIEQTRAFLYGGTEHIHDPFLFDGMQAAVDRIKLAISRSEHIRIYGDYDADGVSSTSLMIHLLRQFDCRFDYYIPHRVHEGYGLNRKALELAQEAGVTLMITVDTGISAKEEIDYANELGIDVIVTDHHEPPEQLPCALAVINPKKPGCPYPFKQLAGVGVALKLAQALLDRWPEELLEIAAIGTVADLMPLTGENRIIVKQGLRQMKSSAYIGIKALMDVSGIDLKEVRETHIGFTLAPRINASGRLESASTAVKLLTTNSEQEAQEVAALLDALNKERQRIVDDMVKEAFAIIEERKQAGTLGKVIVVAQTGWNVGVIGIVASKILDAYYRPTIVLGIDEQTGKAKGSARSIPGFDLYKALTHCAHLLEHYGGHQAAAGMTIEQGQLGELAAQLCRLADEWLTDEHFIPVLHADVECGLDEVNLDSIRQLEELAPFGIGNPSPRFMLKGLSMKEIRTMGKDNQHIKLVLAGTAGEPAAVVEAVGFYKAQAVDWISPTASLDIMGELSVNEWNGTRKPQIMIHDLRVPHLQVFDWRGASRVRGRLEELKRKLPQAEDGLAAALVLLADGMKPLTAVSAGAAAEWAIWHLDHTGCLVPGNELAERQPLRNAKDIVLYGLPFDLAALASALKQLKQAERLYAAFCDGDTADGSVMPHRDMFKQVYASLLSDPVKQTPQLTLIRHISRRSGLSETLVRFMLDVFEELEFIELQGDCYKTVPVSAKKPLTSSIRYQARQNRAEVEQALLYSSCKEMSSWVSDTWSQSEHKENNSLIMEDVI